MSRSFILLPLAGRAEAVCASILALGSCAVNEECEEASNILDFDNLTFLVWIGY